MKSQAKLTKEKERIHPDLMMSEKSVTCRLKEVIQNADRYKDINTLRNDVLLLFDDESLYLSKKKRNEYICNIRKRNSINSLLSYITNIFLNGCNLGVNRGK